MKRILLLLVLVFGFGKSFGQYSGTGVFTKVANLAELTDGYYVITDENSVKLMTNGRSGTATTGYFVSANVSLTNGNIVNPSTNNVWKVARTGNVITIYNEVSEKYVGWGSGNGASIEDVVANTSRWTVTYTTNRFTLNNVATPARQLSHNPGSTRFAAYGNDLQDELQFYKLSASAAPEINLQGNGNDIVSGATSTSLANNTNFGDQNISSGSVVKTFTIQNTGSAALNLTGTPRVVIGGANAADFTVTQVPSTPIAATSGSTTFQITFDPSTVGVKNATVSIANNDSDENPYTFVIQGNGIFPTPIMAVKGNGITIVSGDSTPSVADGTNFGSTAINTTTTKTFTIENTGTANLILPTNPILLMDGTAGFTFTNPTSSNIAPNGSTTFTVSFNSATAGLKEDHIMIASNDNNASSTYEFAINATATDFPANPSGTISGTTPACTNTTLTYTGTIPSDETYYWQTSVTGTSTANNAASNLVATIGGTYFVRAFRGGSWSAGASTGYAVVINTTPAISAHPSTATVGICPGATSAALSVTASGTSLTYQWYKSTDNSNATPGDDVTVGTSSASFTPSNSEIGTFYYYVVVSGASPCPPVTSDVSGARTVNAIPATPQGTITPTSSCGPTNLTYNFAPGESTDGNTYYWQTVSGAQSTSNPVSSPLSRTISGTVYVNSRNASGCWSNQISQAITISTQPSFSAQPTNQTVAAGSNATFTTNGTSFGSYTRQWQESTDGGLTWNNVGTNSNSLVVTSATLSQNQNRYKVIVTNGSCVVESNVAILTVNNLSPNNATGLMACFASTEVDLRWTASTGINTPTGYIVFALPNSTVPQMANAGDANTYVANSNYSLATTYGTLGKVVYKGNATLATITGLTNASEYTFKVVAYIGETQTGWATAINATTGTGIQTYTIAIPNVTNVAATTATTSSSISFNVIPSSSVCNYEYMVVANQGTVTFVPSGDGSSYTVNNIYAGGNQVIYKGNGLSNATITGLTEGNTYCYKVFVRRGTEWSSGVEVCATAALTYCSSNSTVTDPSGITAVNFNTINQTSASTSTYTDYTSISTNVELGESYPLSVRVNTDGNFSVYTRVWIDWNRNGSFEASELYETGFATNTANGLTDASPFTVNVPMNATIGSVRMRVSAKSVLNETTPASCETFQYGEVEDYTINVTRPVGPEIALRGGTNVIFSGSTTANALNQTLFAIQDIGTTSVAKEYTVFSIGTAALNLTGTPIVQITGVNASDFTVTEQPASSIATGATSTFKITFTPSGAGTRTAIVSIANNDTTGNENPFTFVIQGTGKSPEIDVQGGGISIPSGSSVVSVTNNTNFGISQVTGGLVQKTFSILNTGSDILTVSNPVISGSSDFTITANPATSVAINGATTFTVTFNPSSTGPKNAIVVIGNNDLDENPYTFAILGYGVDYVECGLGDEEVIVQQDFETSPATPTWGMTLPASNVHAIRGGTSATNPQVVQIDGQSFQVFNNVNGTVLAFDVVNTSAVTDVSLSFRVGAFYRNIASQGLDASDNVSVEISTDGNNWSREIQVNGFSDARWSFTSGTAIANKVYTGNNTATVFGPSAGGDRTDDGYSSVNLTGLPKVQNLYVRIILKNDSANELWAIDNVVLKGKREAVKTWNGSQWRNGAGVVTTPPIASDAVIINGNYSTTAGNLAGCKCQVNTGYTLTVISGTNMVIESDIKNDGVIDIKDDGSLVQKNDFAENSGDIKYERIAEPMYRYDYTYWSSPVSPQTLGGLSPLTLADKYFKWDSNLQDWTNVLRGDEMVQGLGYIIRAPQTFSTNPLAPEEFTGDFEGTPNNGVVTVAVEGSTTAQKWNLLGNPYPSAISADKFLDSNLNNDLEGTIYVWTHNTPLDPEPNENGFYSYAPNDYAVYNALGGTATAPGAAVYEGYIASGQGFFIKGTANGTATFNNEMRLANRNAQFLRTPEASRNITERSRIWLDISNAQSAYKQILIGYVDGATNEIDREFDGEILGSNALMFYSVISQKTLAIQGRALPFDTNDKVNLGYKTIAAGNLTVSLSNLDGLFTDQNVYLEDKVLNVIHDLKQSDYTFASAIGTFNDRFVLRYTNETLGNPDFGLNNNNVSIGVKGKTVTIKSSIENIQKVSVYDLLGRVIYDSKNVGSREFVIDELTASNQALVVKIYLENGTATSKKIVVN